MRSQAAKSACLPPRAGARPAPIAPSTHYKLGACLLCRSARRVRAEGAPLAPARFLTRSGPLHARARRAAYRVQPVAGFASAGVPWMLPVQSAYEVSTPGACSGATCCGGTRQVALALDPMTYNCYYAALGNVPNRQAGYLNMSVRRAAGAGARARAGPVCARARDGAALTPRAPQVNVAQQPHGVNVTLNFTPWTWWQIGQDGQGGTLAPYGAATQPNVSASAYIDGGMQRLASTNGLAFSPYVYAPARWCQNAASPSPATDQGARPPGLPALRACAPAAAGAARPTLRAARARAARVCRPARGAAPQQLLGRLLRGREPPGPERERQQLGRLLCGVRLLPRAGLLHGHERRRKRHGPVEPLARCARARAAPGGPAHASSLRTLS